VAKQLLMDSETWAAPTAVRPEDAWRPFLRGAGASMVNVITTFPLNKVIFRQQSEGHTIRQALHFMKLEGSSTLYRGIGPPLLQKSLSISLMFGLFGTNSTFSHLLARLPFSFVVLTLLISILDHFPDPSFPRPCSCFLGRLFCHWGIWFWGFVFSSPLRVPSTHKTQSNVSSGYSMPGCLIARRM